MARTYWTRNPTTAPEGQALDAATCHELIEQVTAVEEEARPDSVCILPVPEVVSATWARISFFPMRFDRDGMMRELAITPLCSGGTTGATLRCAVLDGWMRPDPDLDDHLEWAVGAGAVVGWQAPQTLTPGRDRLYGGRLFADGGVPVRARFAVLVWEGAPVGGGDPPLFAGFRVEELVDT